MGKIFIHKEINIAGKWESYGHVYCTNPPEGLWALMHKYGDTYRRTYAPLTVAVIKHNNPQCTPHHLSEEQLVAIRVAIGCREFDKIFGYFPIDSIDYFDDEDIKSELENIYLINGARVIAYEVK